MKLMIAHVIHHIKAELESPLKIEDLAQHFYYSKYHFSREFKKIIGVTPTEYITALKIEKSLTALLTRKQSILKTQLASGYLSSGTFSSTFKKNTGVSPRAYKQTTQLYFKEIKAYEASQGPPLVYYQKQLESRDRRYSLKVWPNWPRDVAMGLVLVGLFKRPIPNHQPVVGMALTKKQLVLFEGLPPGDYYLMGCGIKKSHNPFDYFLLGNSLRAQHDSVLHFPHEGNVELALNLRLPEESDPPILFNFPKLLVELLKQETQ